MKQETIGMMLICDGCGETFENVEGFVCYADDPDGSLIWNDADTSDWIELGGNHYCPHCWSYDDDDNILTKDGHKFNGETHEEIKEDEKLIKEICEKCRHCLSCMCGDVFEDCKLKKEGEK